MNLLPNNIDRIKLKNIIYVNKYFPKYTFDNCIINKTLKLTLNRKIRNMTLKFKK